MRGVHQTPISGINANFSYAIVDEIISDPGRGNRCGCNTTVVAGIHGRPAMVARHRHQSCGIVAGAIDTQGAMGPAAHRGSMGTPHTGGRIQVHKDPVAGYGILVRTGVNHGVIVVVRIHRMGGMVQGS